MYLKLYISFVNLSKYLINILIYYKDNPTVDDINSFYQEIQIMKSAGKHPNIVSLIGYCTIYNKPLLIVEYCSNGDLQTYLRKVETSNTFFVLLEYVNMKIRFKQLSKHSSFLFSYCFRYGKIR